MKGRDVDNGSLTGGDLKNGSVTTSDLGSLLAADFGAGQLPAGPAGTTEVLARRVADVSLASGVSKEVVASCLPGEVAVGGGAVHDGTVADIAGVTYSLPLEADGSPPEDGERATQWLIGAQNHFTSGVDHKLTAYVLCANA